VESIRETYKIQISLVSQKNYFLKRSALYRYDPVFNPRSKGGQHGAQVGIVAGLCTSQIQLRNP
jgi:hypothetical protein